MSSKCRYFIEWTSQKTKKNRFLLKRKVIGSSTALDSLQDSFGSSVKESCSKGSYLFFAIACVCCWLVLLRIVMSSCLTSTSQASRNVDFAISEIETEVATGAEQKIASIRLRPRY